MNDNKRYCPYCNEAHIVSPTYDNLGDTVGYFCNRTKLMTESEGGHPIWDGYVISNVLISFLNSNLDEEAFLAMDERRIIALAKRFAYRIMQTEEAKQKRWNFAFVTYWMGELLKSKRRLLELKTKGGR